MPDKMNEYAEACAERDRLRKALEYIEMMGANFGHIDNADAPCPCGQCMANEADKALRG